MENKREYLIFEDVERNSSLRPLFDSCVTAIFHGNARMSKTRTKPGYSSWDCFCVDRKEILTKALMEYYLYKFCGNNLVYEEAKHFTDAMRKLCGWNDMNYVLGLWTEKVLRDSFFEFINENGQPKLMLKPGEPSRELPQDIIRFACYIAICYMKYDASYASVNAKTIFGYLTRLGSDLPEKLKKYGSGELPKEVAEYKDTTISCKANDAFATIKITLKDSGEESYRKALDFLCRLLEPEFAFPKSYSIDFKSPEKNWLPAKRLPQNGVHRLFAGAVQYNALHEKIERYARLAMNGDEWYDDPDPESEYCAMPSTFAVFALWLLGKKYHPLVCDYLKICDGEHQSIHGQFIVAYIEKYGFTEQGLELYDLCKNNIQDLPKKLLDLREKFTSSKLTE